MRQTTLLAAMALIATLAASVLSQTQIRTNVDLVVVPVTVRGEDGKLVAGLMKDDFRVAEDGKEQTIANFDGDPQPLSAAIIVDSGMTSTQLNWLYPQGATPILYTLVSNFNSDDRMIAFRYDARVYKLSDFTNDSEVILKSFGEIPAIAKTRPEAPRDILGEKGPRFLRAFLNLLGKGHEAAIYPRAAGHLHDAVHAAAVALQDDPENRRKVIVVISDGRVVGNNDFSFDQNAALLFKHQIQVYGISAAFGSFGMLTNYANASGGDVFAGSSTKTLEASFDQVTEQARNQYVLSYISTNRPGRFGTFRTITVKTRSPKLKVIHRLGYLQLPEGGRQ